MDWMTNPQKIQGSTQLFVAASSLSKRPGNSMDPPPEDPRVSRWEWEGWTPEAWGSCKPSGGVCCSDIAWPWLSSLFFSENFGGSLMDCFKIPSARFFVGLLMCYAKTASDDVSAFQVCNLRRKQHFLSTRRHKLERSRRLWIIPD